MRVRSMPHNPADPPDRLEQALDAALTALDLPRRPRVDAGLLNRFMAKVERVPNGCWNWTAGCTSRGYGSFTIGNQTKIAHRIAYEMFLGPIPEGLTIDHLCRNTRCVNPAHLEPVTGQENILRGTSFSAVNAQKTHCIHGHEFTPENTYVFKRKHRPGVGRQCLTCKQRERRRSGGRSNGDRD